MFFHSGAFTFFSSLFRKVVEQKHLPVVLGTVNFSTFIISLAVIVIPLLDTNKE